ncbi:hypothetical protein MMC19_002928 [Ptychographa xylographoides]|nr:hypothetical protein [Ptychographa xylographoides]
MPQVFGPPPDFEPLYSNVADILRYLKSSFEEEAVLDNIPLEFASCSGAWHAWIAHRRVTVPDLPRAREETPEIEGERAPSSDTLLLSAWNWDGVWEKRVKSGIEASISEPVLYGDDSEDPVRESLYFYFPD